MMRGCAVITGAAGGLGIPISRRMAEAGFHVLLVDRSPAVAQVADDIRSAGLLAEHSVADLSTDEGVAAVADAVRATGIPLMALVNNAGITRDARMQNMTTEQFEQVIEVNLLVAMRLTLGLRELFAEGSSVVSMSSRAALGNFGQSNYVTSKSALIGFTRALAQQWAPRVRANAVAPGLIDSPMTQAMPAEVLSGLVDKVPAGRIGTADDVADAVVFLVSDAASYITGQVLTVCGGRSIAP
ncbi:MAG: SDR family oxidoreductase [Actinobacteria bacterium]|nr:SDR family oxidoreductase [Actinomycetota bacterium]